MATWWKRENLLLGLALLVLTAIAWVYTLSQAGAMRDMAMPAATDSVTGPTMPSDTDTMGSMEMPASSPEQTGTVEPAGAMVQPGGLSLFLVGWAVMMIAMMLPAALPLILVYQTIARRRLGPRAAIVGIVALLVG